MALDQNELALIEQYIYTYKEMGYDYYVVSSLTYTDYVADQPNIVLYVSKEKVEMVNTHSYYFTGDFIELKIKSADASRNYLTERVEVSEDFNTIISLSDYEFVYSNVPAVSEVSVVPNLLSKSEYNVSAFSDSNSIISIGIAFLIGLQIFKMFFGGFIKW